MSETFPRVQRQHTTVAPFVRRELVSTMKSVSWGVSGRVTDVVGQVMEAVLPGIQLGSLVEIRVGQRETDIVLGEVVGFRDERVLILPFQNLAGISPGCSVTKHGNVDRIPVGDFLLGTIVDPFLQSLTDTRIQVPSNCEQFPIDRLACNPLKRQRIHEIMPLGVRTIDGLLTLGAGQRIGILAGSGVGKSVLLGMMAQGTEADVNVIGLIGERGREVREFIERDLGLETLKRSVVVAVTSDQSPLMKVRAARLVHTIAEYFSSKGKNVLLMMDSVSRVAMAQREIGLSVGEPPTTKGYTPSVFSMLPALLERSGPQKDGEGAISGIYTVLADGDDLNDPIVDAVRSILDGQISLSRQLAARGFFPAIDLGQSISRVMNDVVSEEHLRVALKLKRMFSTYEENFDLVQIGAYQPGSNPTLDEAIRLMPRIEAFMMQDIREKSSFAQTLNALQVIMGGDK